MEEARQLLRELSPIKLEFEVPRLTFDVCPQVKESFGALEKYYSAKVKLSLSLSLRTPFLECAAIALQWFFYNYNIKLKARLCFPLFLLSTNKDLCTVGARIPKI